MSAAAPSSELTDLLARLHRNKAAAYGDAWRKRGEVISIFANLARKYDRLVRALAKDTPTATEPLIDTVADLAVYAAKYLTWLAETQPTAFASASPGVDPAQASAEHEEAALEAVLAAVADWEKAATDPPPADSDEAAARITDSFGELEAALIAQTQHDPAEGIPAERKVALAWALTAASLRLLERLASEDPRRLDPLRDAVAAMEAPGGNPRSFTDEIIDKTLQRLGDRPAARIALLGASGTALRLRAVLHEAGLAGEQVAIFDDQRLGSDPRFRPLDELRTHGPALLVVCSDEDKAKLLVAAADALGGAPNALPEVVIAGTAHLEFSDALFAELDAPALVPSYATGSPHTRIHLFQCLRAAAANGLTGAIVEFGAFKGGTTAWLARTAQRLGLAESPVIGFDSWAGFPPRRSLLDLYEHPRCVFTDLDAVRAFTEPLGVELVPGDIADTYRHLEGRSLLLCFFDTDNYSPTRAALELCAEQLVVGGAIVFDHVATLPDYVDTLGERIAAYEVLDPAGFLHLHDTGVFIKLA